MMNKNKTNYAFIDANNLYLGVKTQGWRLDYRKLRVYLENKLSVKKAFLFIGYIPEYAKIYNKLTKAGFELIFKQTSSYKDRYGNTKHKGNVDAELVLSAAAIEYDNYDKAIVVSGDGDFICLYDFLNNKGKLDKIIIPGTRYSHLLGSYIHQIIYISNLESSLRATAQSNK